MTLLSTDALYRDFKTVWYKNWMKRLKNDPKIHHAKFWEQAMIYAALKKNGVLKSGNRGLGFGVGLEPLVSIFANEGVKVTATDQSPEGNEEWDNGQLAHGKQSLYYKNLVAKRDFDALVEFMHHDMNTTEKAFLNKYDFTWSNCVIGHLGSMKLSEEYFKRHAKYLKYGGVSVLTTEMTISSLTETVVDNSGTIIWRLSDIYRVFNDMLNEDMVAARFKLRLAKDPEDYKIFSGGLEEANAVMRGDNQAFHAKLMFSNWAITQIQLIFKKRKVSKIEKLFYKKLFAYDYMINKRKLKKYMESGGDIADYRTAYETTDLDVVATKPKALTVKAGATAEALITYTNNSSKPLFSYGLNTPLHVMPLLLATAEPINRSSLLHTKDWFSSNRPAAVFADNKHRVLPGQKFSYRFTIKAPKQKGRHAENFCLVLEGMGDIPKSAVELSINVT